MYKTRTMNVGRIYREERFRTPLERERRLGLWVDRIGRSQGDRLRPLTFRVLGQYAAIAVERGGGVLRTAAGALHEVGPRDAFVLFPEAATLYHAHVEWDTCWVVWNGPEAEVLGGMSGLRATSPVIHGGAAPVMAAWRRLAPLMARQGFHAILARKMAVLELVLDLAALAADVGGGSAPPWLAGAMRALAPNAGKPEPLDGLARRLHVSPAHFRRLFKAHTGATPKAFQMAARVTRAKEMLTSGRSIKETADALGFSDVFHFMRVFRRVAGQTAGRYAGVFKGPGSGP